MFKRNLLVVGAAMAACALSGIAGAASITGGADSTFANYTQYDISNGTVKTGGNWVNDVYLGSNTSVADWAAYAIRGGAATAYTDPDPQVFEMSHKAGGTASISTLDGIHYSYTTNGRVKLAFTGGDATATGPAVWGAGSDPSNPEGDIFANKSLQSGTDRHQSFTTKLIAGDETLVVYVHGENGTARLDVTVGSDTYSVVNETIGANTQGYGRYLINVAGGNVGDVLTLKVAVDQPNGGSFDDPSGKWSAVGIDAVSVVTAVPEPASLSLLGGASVLLLNRRRRVA